MNGKSKELQVEVPEIMMGYCRPKAEVVSLEVLGKTVSSFCFILTLVREHSGKT